MNYEWDEPMIDFDEYEYDKERYHRDLPKNDVMKCETIIKDAVYNDRKRGAFLGVIRKEARLSGYSTLAGICTTVMKSGHISSAQLNCLTRFYINKFYDRI